MFLSECTLTKLDLLLKYCFINLQKIHNSNMQIRVCIDSYIQNEIGNYDCRRLFKNLTVNKTHDVGALYILYRYNISLS